MYDSVSSHCGKIWLFIRQIIPPPLSSSMMDTLFYSHYFIAKKEGVKGKFVNGFEYIGQYFLLFSDDTARDHFLLFSFRSHVLIVFALFVYNQCNITFFSYLEFPLQLSLKVCSAQSLAARNFHSNRVYIFWQKKLLHFN